ncbi:hypothetical protein [Bryobacter aggregatus]|uniref:hypothetical protein n=1 Tax=Bryobacter aggregatus TaxID=360054 RepID=UPI0012BAC6D9|nr:hypothetical protein [Bryobacter aggregatus]
MSTGRDASGSNTLLADGSVDPNWKMVSHSGSHGGSSGTEAIVTSSLTGGSTSAAKYISPVAGAGAVVPGYYVFRQMVDLSCHDPATTMIAGDVIADDSVQIFVNGVARTASLGPYHTVNPFSISGSGGGIFVQGWNVVDFVVRNAGTSPTTSGMRVQITSAIATAATSASGAKFEVTRSPAGANLTGGASVGLSSGSEAVTWTLEGSAGGTLTPNGTAATYVAPSFFADLSVAIVKATNGTGVVSYQPLWFNAGGAAGVVTISGNSGTAMGASTTRSLSASVTNVPSGEATTARWSILSYPPGNSPAGGTLSTGTNCAASTTYTAPSTITNNSQPVRIQAESCYNSSWKSEVQVNLSTGTTVQVSLAPKDFSTLENTSTKAFTATVSGATSNTQVNWSIVGGGPGQLASVTGNSVIYNPAGGTGSVTLRATSQENSNVSDSWSFTLTNPAQSGSGAFTPASGTVETTLQVTVNGGSSINNIGEVWFNLSSSSTQNVVASPRACRFRYSRSILPDRIQLDDAAGAGSGWQEARFGTNDLPSNAACAIVASQSSVSTSGSILTLTIRLQNRGMSGARYAYLWTALPQNGSTPMAPQNIGTWTPSTPITMTLSSSLGSTPSVYSGQTVLLRAQVTNMPTGGSVVWSLDVPDGSIASTTPDIGYQGAANYTAHNSGSNRVIKAIARVLSNTGVESEKAEISINVLSTASSPPTVEFYNPFTLSDKNPSVVNQTLAANGSTPHWINWGVKNTPYHSSYCTPTGCYNIQEVQLNINRSAGESNLSQIRANGCRVLVQVYPGNQWGGTPSYYVLLMDDAGMNYGGTFFYPQSGGNFTLNNSQCTITVNSSIGAYAMAAGNDVSILGLGMQFTFKTGFQGKREIYILGQRLGGDWSGWGHPGSLNLN